MTVTGKSILRMQEERHEDTLCHGSSIRLARESKGPGVLEGWLVSRKGRKRGRTEHA